MTNEPDSLPHAELKKRKREAVIIAVSAILIVLLTSIELHLTRLSSEAPMGSNILIFGIINIIILLIILLFYLLCRNIMKLMIERRNKIPGAGLRTKLVLAFVGFLALIVVIQLIPAIMTLIGALLTSLESSAVEEGLLPVRGQGAATFAASH